MLVLLVEFFILATFYGLYFNHQLHITLNNFFKFLHVKISKNQFQSILGRIYQYSFFSCWHCFEIYNILHAANQQQKKIQHPSHLHMSHNYLTCRKLVLFTLWKCFVDFCGNVISSLHLFSEEVVSKVFDGIIIWRQVKTATRLQKAGKLITYLLYYYVYKIREWAVFVGGETEQFVSVWLLVLGCVPPPFSEEAK